MTERLKLKIRYVSDRGLHCVNTLVFVRKGDDAIQVWAEAGDKSCGYRMSREDKRKLIEFLMEE